MIKLKNLWKIALAAMTMSTMLVACDTTTEEKKANTDGVYSYTVNIADISAAWGGSKKSPAFSVVLLSDANKDLVVAAKNLKVSPITDPEYQIACWGDMKITDTSTDGVFAPYGKNAVEDVYQYYDGVAATITAETFTLFVDMNKIVKTQLKALWEGDSECVVGGKKDDGTDVDVLEADVDLTAYKPYVIALASKDNDEDNYVVSAWIADLMAMAASSVAYPDVKKEGAPVVPTCNDLDSYNGTMVGWAETHTALTDNAFTFTAAGGDAFAFTVGSWDFKACGVTVEALNTEYKLVEGGENIVFADGVLTAGTEYTATLIVKGKHEAYVKVSAK